MPLEGVFIVNKEKNRLRCGVPISNPCDTAVHTDIHSWSFNQMGGVIEINDTLKLRRGDGFPSPIVAGCRYSFSIEGRRLYHLSPIRVFLVEEIAGKWNFIGHALILEQTVDAVRNITTGVFEVAKWYSPEHAHNLNEYDAPMGKGYP